MPTGHMAFVFSGTGDLVDSCNLYANGYNNLWITGGTNNTVKNSNFYAAANNAGLAMDTGTGNNIFRL